MFGKSYIDSTYSHQPSTIAKGDMRKQPIIGTFVQIYYFIVGAAAIPVRLYLRGNFGERSISPMAWGVSLFLHIWYAYEYVKEFTFININPRSFIYKDFDFTVFDTIVLMIIFGLNAFSVYLIDAFILKGGKHFRTIIDKAKKGVLPENSYYRGDGKYFRKYLGKVIKTPLGSLTVDEDIQRMVVEPFFAAIFGLIGFIVFAILAMLVAFLPTDAPLLLGIFISFFAGTFLVLSLSAICLFLEEIGIFLRPRYAALDMIDGQVDLNQISEIKADIISRKVVEKSALSDEKEPSFVKICHDER